MLSNNLWEVVTDSWKQIAYVLWEQTNKKKTSVNLRMSMTVHGSDRVEKDVCKLVWVRRFLLRYSLLSLHCRTGIMRQPIQIFTWHQQTLFTGRRKSNVNHGNIATIYISLCFTVWQCFCYVLFFNFYLFWSVKKKKKNSSVKIFEMWKKHGSWSGNPIVQNFIWNVFQTAIGILMENYFDRRVWSKKNSNLCRRNFDSGISE